MRSTRRLIPSFTDQSYLIFNLLGDGSVYLYNDQERLYGQEVPLYDPQTDAQIGKQLLLPKPESGNYTITVIANDESASYSLFAYDTRGQVATHESALGTGETSAELTFSYQREPADPDQLLTVTSPDSWEAIARDSRWQYAFTRWTLEQMIADKDWATIPYLLRDYQARDLLPAALAERISQFLQAR